MMGFGCDGRGAPAEAEGASSSSPPQLSSARISSRRVEVPKSILKFADELKMKVVQTKSQRKFGPAHFVDCNWEPEKGSEVFVGRIPWDSDERELVPFLEQAGSIFQIRLMTESTNGGGAGVCRGYCFVKYFTPEQAQVAVSMLHKQCIREGWTLVLSANIENVRLVVFGVPAYISAQHVALELSKFGDVLKVELVSEPATPPLPQRVAYVTFANHRAAAAARKKMLQLKPLLMWGKLVYVDWAQPEQLVQQTTPPPYPLTADQDWSFEGGSYQVAQAPAPFLAFPPQMPQPVYSLIQPMYPLIPVYLMSEQCAPPPPLAAVQLVEQSPQPQGAEMSGDEAAASALGFFPAGPAQFYSPPPPFIIHPAAEEMFWYPSPSQSPIAIVEQVYDEGCGADDNDNTLSIHLT